MESETPVLEVPPVEKPEEKPKENKSFGYENLTPEDIENREKNIEILKQAVNRWIEENIKERTFLNKKELSQLVKFLHETYPEQIKSITDQFIDRQKYKNRPAVLFYEAGKDKYDVDIYLLGWRSPDENDDHKEIDDEPEEVPSHLAQPDGTYIHDHEAAEAAIEVLDYDPVTEIIYLTPQTRTSHLPLKDKKFFDPRLPEDQRAYEYQEIRRQFAPGSNIQVSAPYIHVVRGPDKKLEHGMSVTMHAYSTDPETIPKDFLPPGHEEDTRKTGLYKMDYFRKAKNESGEQVLVHEGYYVMLNHPGTGSETYMEGLVEGVTKPEDIPGKKGEFIFC